MPGVSSLFKYIDVRSEAGATWREATTYNSIGDGIEHTVGDNQGRYGSATKARIVERCESGKSC